MNRQQRRAAAGKQQLRQGVRRITDESGGLCGLAWIGPEQLPDLLVEAFLGNDQCFALAQALLQTVQRIQAGDPAVICLTCDSEIRDPDQVGLFAVLRPEALSPTRMLGSAICRTCCARQDLQPRAFEAYKKIWPKFRPLNVTAGPGGVQ